MLEEAYAIEIGESVHCRVGPEDHFDILCDECGISKEWFYEEECANWICTWRVKPEHIEEYKHVRYMVLSYLNECIQDHILDYAKA